MRKLVACRCAITLILLVGISFDLQANMASPSRPGQLNSEPTGLDKILIVAETLTIDLRPLLDAGDAMVEAIYQINNLGPQRKIELLFAVASSRVNNFQVRFDDREIANKIAALTAINSSWKAPETTPPINGSAPLGYSTFNEGLLQPISFSIEVPTGHHEIKVRYRSQAAKNLSGKPLIYWQFAYVLAPAREWGGFGGLDVTVKYPEAWNIATSLQMPKEGAALHGKFSQVPADSLAITLQSPLPKTYHLYETATRIIFFLLLILGGITIGSRGWKRGRQQKSLGGSTLLSCAGWAILIFIAGAVAILGPNSLIPKTQYAAYGYDEIFEFTGLFMLSCLAFLSGLPIYLIPANIAKKKSSSSLK